MIGTATRTCIPILLLALAGCERIMGTAEQPALPTEQALYQQYRDTLEVILVRGYPSREEAMSAVDAFRQALATDHTDQGWYGRSEKKAYQDARTFARRRIEEDIVSQLRQSRDLGGWKIVEAAIRAYWVLKPDELLYSELYEYAIKMNNMPALTNAGYVIDEEEGGVVHVFFKLDDPVSKASVTVKVREGEVFYTGRFKLEEIVGNHLAYRVRYLDVEDHVFTVESIRRGAPEIPEVPSSL